MKLSVIIVNYNVRYFLEQCLISVKRAIEKIDAEVYIVDNASTDGSVEMLKEKFPWVKIIANSNNEGFSKANNQGIKTGQGEYVLLLNPDTVVAEDTFEKCIAFMDIHNDAGALGVHMIDGKGNFLPEAKRGLPTPAVAFFKMFGFSRFFPKSKNFGQYHLGFLPENETHEVDILSGAFMFIRKKVFDQIGLLDETFFMYGEDIDLSYRITQAGYKNYYFSETTIIHYKGESTKKGSLNYVKVFYKAMSIFAIKHFNGNQSVLFSALINVAIFFRGILTVLSNLFSSSYLFIIDALLSFAGIYFVKTYWENRIKYSDNYYPNQFLFMVVPIYIVIWIISTFLSGGYDKPFRISNIIRGIFFGTLAIAAVYAFLPNEWRFSRAMILLGAFWTAFEMLLTRTSYHLIKYQNLSPENDDEKRTLIVGTKDECERAEKLLLVTGPENEVVSLLSDQDKLQKLSIVYDINEIIFCSLDFHFERIINAMMVCGNKINYKIFNEGFDVFIGSNSKDTAGDLYSFNHSLNLGKSAAQRRKRLLDIIVCLIFIPLFPINLLLIKNFGKFLWNWFEVLLDKKTWVGYAEDGVSKLPIIRKGIISVAENFSQLDLDADTLSKMNVLYAKHYEVNKDVKLLLRNYKKLGK